MTGPDFIEVNVRADRYLIAQAVADCDKCDRRTRLAALGVLPGHEVIALDDGAGDEPSVMDTWEVAAQAALLFDVDYLPESVGLRMLAMAPGYGVNQEQCWANHCEHCGAAYLDADLFCEPGGAFLPTNEASARRILWVAVNEPFEAHAAGYAPEPEVFGTG